MARNQSGNHGEFREPLQDTQQRQRAIGAEIRRVYNNVVSEDVPRHLLDLLRELDAQQRLASNDGA